MKHFDKQLMLEAMMVEAGDFEAIAATEVAEVAHIGLGANPVFNPIALSPGELEDVRTQFVELIASYLHQDKGYPSRRAVAEVRYKGDFDHLARYGEWDETVEPKLIRVGT
jgi:hypothetical protein